MMCGFPGSYFCINAFSETDLTEGLKEFDVPTLILHGDDDHIVPIGAVGHALIKVGEGRGKLESLPEAAAARHVYQTLKDGVNEDLLAFFKT